MAVFSAGRCWVVLVVVFVLVSGVVAPTPTDSTLPHLREYIIS